MALIGSPARRLGRILHQRKIRQKRANQFRYRAVLWQRALNKLAAKAPNSSHACIWACLYLELIRHSQPPCRVTHLELSQLRHSREALSLALNRTLRATALSSSVEPVSLPARNPEASKTLTFPQYKDYRNYRVREHDVRSLYNLIKTGKSSYFD